VWWWPSDDGDAMEAAAGGTCLPPEAHVPGRHCCCTRCFSGEKKKSKCDAVHCYYTFLDSARLCLNLVTESLNI